MDVRKLVSFHGRVGRGYYWGMNLGLIVAYLIAYGLASSGSGILIAIAVVTFVLIVVVSLATSVKRWHDRNKSGAWLLIGVIPIIGSGH